MKPILKTLKNGLRVLVIPEPTAPTLTAMVLVGVGSDYESKQDNGISHFLEHLFFKGTTKRPSARMISEELDRLGAITNAFTSDELTGYYAKGSPKHVATFINVLADIYLNSTFPDAEIAKEKGVVIEEMNMYEDMPQYIVERELGILLFGDQPAGRSTIGTKATVSSFTRDDVIRYRKSHYTALNSLVVISGAISASDALRKVKTAFAPIAVGSKKKKPKVKTAQSAPGIRIAFKNTDQAHMALVFRTVPIGHRDAPALRLLATILGRSMSSRLFVRLREELGVAYYVSAGQDSSTDHGEFDINAGIDKSRVVEIITEIIREIKQLKDEMVPVAELAKAREYSLGMMRLGLESTDEIANFYGFNAILGQPLRTLEMVAREYATVTPQNIRNVARKYFTKKHANIVLVGPFKETALPGDVFDSL